MKGKVDHSSNLVALRRVEGQIRGIQQMVDDNKYCLDIVNQIHASVNGLYRVAEKILAKHMEHCVTEALETGTKADKKKKIEEITGLVRRLHKIC